ncbi:putative acyl-[acyl-carrier-protein]--UDP-N-acetylglucosamine O-acyltransferase [Carex littledalei]|uniref:Putative acyl-[acyl-carrier-protein]--UDP-N-acetylglucosamine O-acyltransferase n=1 Tax=Carex littledalei TaxID=544730 RepID=A0A833QKT0_9POAL|nr:putative acyl-[acyl-carrier-protein]--UDP-N-acetylglucosamine O-acyltransferase [Carex littledalei]
MAASSSRALRAFLRYKPNHSIIATQSYTSNAIACRHLHQGTVHPSAIVHPDAVIGEGVSIGPFCTVSRFARIGNECQLHVGSHIMGHTELGDNCVLLTGAVVGADTPGQTTIGNRNVIGHYAVVGVKCQDLKYKKGDECFLQIGNNNDIREHTSIHRSSNSTDMTVIGDNNLIMGSCHVAHDCKIGSHNIFANGTLLAGHVVVEDYVHTAGSVAVHQFCQLGSYSFIGGGSTISQDVPKYMMVSGARAELRGLNLEGLRRNSFSTMEVQKMRKAYCKIFMASDAINGSFDDRLSQVENMGELADSEFVLSMIKSIRASFDQGRRGICKVRSWFGA